MGTLFNQAPRLENTDTTRLGVVDMEEFDRKLSELQDYAATYEMPFADVLAAYKVQSDITLARDTLFMQIRDWDIKDEHLAGFGKIAKQFCAAMAAYAKGDKDALADLACDLGSIEEQLQGLMGDPCKYPTEPPEYKGQ